MVRPSRWNRLCCLVAGISLAFASGAATELPSIRWRPDPASSSRQVVEVAGVDPAEWAVIRQADHAAADWGKAWLTVFAEVPGCTNPVTLPAMLGTYDLGTNALRFTPQFPFEPGVRYRAEFSSPLRPSSIGVLKAEYVAPRRSLKRTTVLREVFPSSDVLPENLLKFYLLFSAPMGGGTSYDHLHLLRENGSEVEVPFLRLEEELWDPDMRRLTVLIDPGRIKRGVQPNEIMGPSIREGGRFTLLVDAGFKDASGTPLQQAFRKTFQVGPPVRTALDPSTWRLHGTRAGTREPVILQFSRPMDYALATRAIRVVTAGNARVAGVVRLLEHELRWRFVPDLPWIAGPHRLMIQPTLEDLAGNNIGKAFEVGATELLDRQVPASDVSLPFTVHQ